MSVQRTAPRGATLVAWANGVRVGTWSVVQGEHRLQYDDAWAASPLGRPLSLSLPFTAHNLPHRGEVVRHYFDNLLPDSETIRRRMAERFATADAGTFSLLAAVGRDCVGAVQLLAPGEVPQGFDRVQSVALDDMGVQRTIDAALNSSRAFGGGGEDEGFRISLAGAQEKTALLRWQGRWRRPLGSTPTTHIVKLPLGLVGNIRADMHDSVENEWLCAQLLARLGLAVAECSIETFGARKVLMVERFDRAVQQPARGEPWIARLPQEDFCQVLGLPGTRKYESDGGPGVRDILRVLERGSRAQDDKLAFAKTLLAFWLMAATDGHGKNFSIFIEPGGSYRLTPLYDVLSAWPIIGDGVNRIRFQRTRLAMALRSTNPHYHLREIRARHWQVLASQTHVPGAFDEMVAMVLQVPQVLGETQAALPPEFPKRVFTAIAAGMRAQADAFVAGL